jgi:hypothetical protein
MFIRKRLVCVYVACLCLAFAERAHADVLAPGGRDVGKISEISRGVKELGVDALFLTNYSKVGSGGASALRMTALGSLAFRYFIGKNLAATLNLGGLYRSFDAEGKATDVAATGTVGAAYYASLGGGMFVAPGVGIGALYGGRKVVQGPTTTRDTVFGGVARVGVGLVFYPSSRFNVFARPELTAVFGSAKPTEVPPGGNTKASSFFGVDGGFSVGASYIF